MHNLSGLVIGIAFLIQGLAIRTFHRGPHPKSSFASQEE
jgi:hypothetical protein